MKENNTSIAFESVLQDTELSHLHEVVQFLENTEGVVLFPEKHMAALRQLVSKKLDTLYLEDATMPIKKVMTTVLNSLSDTLTADILLQITTFTIEKWNNLIATKQLQTV